MQGANQSRKRKIDVILSERSESKDPRTGRRYTGNSAFGAGDIYNAILPRSFDSGLRPALRMTVYFVLRLIRSTGGKGITAGSR